MELSQLCELSKEYYQVIMNLIAVAKFDLSSKKMAKFVAIKKKKKFACVSLSKLTEMPRRDKKKKKKSTKLLSKLTKKKSSRSFKDPFSYTCKHCHTSLQQASRSVVLNLGSIAPLGFGRASKKHLCLEFEKKYFIFH